VAASISSKDALQALVDRTMQHFGRIDVLVCNAASNPYYGPMAGISDEQFRKILDNNVLSNHWLINMTVPQMIERKRARSSSCRRSAACAAAPPSAPTASARRPTCSWRATWRTNTARTACA
jgi:NAD(P)-dependent dehydrogenase (short-subunit alcohol dehydrogenase family)